MNMEFVKSVFGKEFLFQGAVSYHSSTHSSATYSVILSNYLNLDFSFLVNQNKNNDYYTEIFWDLHKTTHVRNARDLRHIMFDSQ